jgi:YegS/Rv2252/BmrU family lipid kinase
MIANPASGRASGRKLGKAEDLITAKGVRLETLYTTGSGEAVALAREAVRKKPDLVIAAGGDGTLNEVVNGLAGSGVPMAILPLGTTNVLARELNIPAGVEGAVGAALGRVPRTVSLGRITAEGRSRYFCFTVGVGYDAAAVQGVRSRAKKLSGKLAYILSGLRVLLAWNPEEIEATADGSAYRCHTLIVSNTRKYAGDFVVAPNADIKEPLLHMFLLHGSRRTDIIRLALGIMLGRLDMVKGLTRLTGKTLEVKGASHMQVDGDYAGNAPASISVVPDAMRIIF